MLDVLDGLTVRRNIYRALKKRLREMRLQIDEADDFKTVGVLLDRIFLYWSLFKAFALSEFEAKK